MRTRNALLIGGVVLGPALAAGASESFTDEAAARGLAYVATATVANGRGLAFVDLDDDGDADAVTLGAVDGRVGVFENDGAGFFTDRSEGSGIGPLLDASGVIAGDYDRDGDLDLYISRWAANVLLRNDGAFAFADVTDSAGVGDDGLGHGCGWGDYDVDGWLDLYVANQDGPNRLYRNRGDGTFVDVAPTLGVDLNIEQTPGVIEGSFQASFFDFDNDGDPDLYVSKIKGYCSSSTATPGGHLFENHRGTFTEITIEAGAEACVDAMCLAIGDFDNNGYQDLYQTGVPTRNSLLMNMGDGTFVEDDMASGTVSYALGWGSVFFDCDNDGFLDLFVCNTFQSERLYRHEGQWPCVDVADDTGLADAGRAYMGREAARYAVGATVSVRTGETWQMREVIAGCNYKNQNELVLHFGLGAFEAVDEVVVRWPGGVTRSLGGLPANETWSLYPPEKLGDGDHDGDRDLDDFVILAVCFTGDGPGALLPGCEMMDYDGDADVDLVDFGSFLAAYSGPQDDCDGNDLLDLLDILDGGADQNANGVLDACEQAGGDLNLDGRVDAADLTLVVQHWGPCDSPCGGDTNGDRLVDVGDLLAVLLNWSG
jgi:hypothetical protein